MVAAMPVPLLALTLAACNALDPATRDATQYVSDVQPLMLENARLSERLLLMAAQVYNQDVPEDGLARPWIEEVAPLAQHLAIEAENTPAPADWKADHTSLVVIWTDRSVAFRELGEALVLADQDRWMAGRDAVASYVKREEQWFRTVNDRLRPFELEIEQYP